MMMMMMVMMMMMMMMMTLTEAVLDFFNSRLIYSLHRQFCLQLLT